MTLRLDDCSHCACVTHLTGFDAATAIRGLGDGTLGCWNCQDQQDEDPDGHIACVALFDDEDRVLWDGRHG